MTVIHKMRVAWEGSTRIPGRPVHFAFQDEKPTVWFERDDTPSATVHIVPTGGEWGGRHLFTTIFGPTVWHLIGDYGSRPRRIENLNI